MKAIQVVKALGPIDVKSIQRDSILRWMLLLPVVIVVVLRLGLPPVAGWAWSEFQFDVTLYYPLFMSFLSVSMNMMYGAIIGFLLLDQRDDRTVTALQVTPLSLAGYVAYRIGVPTLLGVLVTLFIIPAAGLVQLEAVELLAVALAGAPFAPLSALFLVGFAENKVQGFALMKAGGTIFVPPILAYFVPSGWQLAFGLVPTYWPVKLFWVLEAGEPHAWVYLLVALVYQVLLIVLLLRRFDRVMYQ